MLWAGRMLLGEGWRNGKGAAVLWTTLNRFLHASHNFGTYENLIRNFSQPINARWLPGGDKWKQYRNHPNPRLASYASDAAGKRRKRIRNTSWRELPIRIQQLVGLFAIGKLPPPPQFRERVFTNFGSHPTAGQGYKDILRWQDGEIFFQDIPPKGAVAILDSVPKETWKKIATSGKRKISAGTAGGGLALLMGGGLLLWALSKKQRAKK
jgi:hypothetical protein